jgi:riboflavin kinase/FMN adenylyltransferase
VTFLHFLHGEKNYDGLDALKNGIAQDVVDLLDWWKK